MSVQANPNEIQNTTDVNDTRTQMINQMATPPDQFLNMTAPRRIGRNKVDMS